MKYLITIATLFSAEGFAPSCLRPSTMATNRLQPLWYVNTDLPDVSDMKASEMKKELDSYGVNTKSMFDKAQFEKALLEARLQLATIGADEIKEQINLGNKPSTDRSDTERKNARGKPRTERTMKREKGSSNGQESDTKEKETRQQKFDNAFQEGIAMKISELKQELKDRGISTSSFFEKVDMAKAYAESIADNILKMKQSTESDASSHRT
jgi:predicted HTH domain antitoxin